MFYQSQRMKLRCVRIVKKSRTNDIVICEDLNTSARNLYTLLAIKEHQTVKTYLEVFEQAHLTAQDSYIDSFSDQGAFCMVFAYQQERPLKDFYMGESYTLAECENVCISVIMACITSNLPYPVLYLILEQGQLHLAKDHTVCLGHQIDLEELDPARTERDCGPSPPRRHSATGFWKRKSPGRATGSSRSCTRISGSRRLPGKRRASGNGSQGGFAGIRTGCSGSCCICAPCLPFSSSSPCSPS